MADRLLLLRRVIYPLTPLATLSGGKEFLSFAYEKWRYRYATTTAIEKEISLENDNNNKKNNCFTLPPFTYTVDGAALGKTIAAQKPEKKEKASTTNSTMTAVKWVTRCCPELPRSLIQKLFRLRQVRREFCNDQIQECRPKRVGAKDMMNYGDRIILPVQIEKSPMQAKAKVTSSEEEMKFLRSLIIYKDPAIVAVNKPPGMPVQGGIGVKRSLDELAAEYLRFNDSESPRLVHRLDKDCSGVLVMGRTRLSATTLHSILHEKTREAAPHDLESGREIIRKTYWALVIGSPRHSEGLISLPLQKVVLERGKFERITVVDNYQSLLAQSAITKYRIIGSPCHGFSWLELSPVTGRKHQLRVHCAEVLGTPIVGDYKYGWQAHKNFKPFPCSSKDEDLNEEIIAKKNSDAFGLNFGGGSISDKRPRLHLHCKEMILPDISLAVQHATKSSSSTIDLEIEDLGSIKLDAPLSSHMQRSWQLLY